MTRDPTARAIELAKSGTCRSVEDIRKQLRTERFDRVYEYVSGRGFLDQLKALMREVKSG